MIEHGQYLAISGVVIMTDCKSFAYMWRKFIMRVVENKERSI